MKILIELLANKPELGRIYLSSAPIKGLDILCYLL